MTAWGGRAVMTRRAAWQDRINTGDVPCGRCGLPVTGKGWHLGHQHDRALGGSDDDSNLWPEHARCNTAAGGRLAHALRRRPVPAPVKRRTW